MREDMAKVIVERPRIKPFNNRKRRKEALEDLPTHVGVRRDRAFHGDRKHLNENLAPLRRYLASQVGRPWNKVYSEIAAHLRADSAVQQHVRDHLHDFVALKPRRNINDWYPNLRGGLWRQKFYVDPRTGLLCRTDRLPEEKARRRAQRNEKSPPCERIELSADRELRLIKGIWYEIELARLPEPIYRVSRESHMVLLKGRYFADGARVEVELSVRRLDSSPVRDVVTGEWIAIGPAIDDEENRKLFRHQHPRRHYAVAKRVLSSRELRQHGLSNSLAEPGEF